MYKIIPQVQAYPWGSNHWIPEFLGSTEKGEHPWAELWFGAHPKAPSMIEGRQENLLEYISANPERVLGQAVITGLGPELPFLVKLLAAEKPLSIQCHPNKEQATEGYAHENKIGIPLDAPLRTYKDPNHKPEILLAIHPCTALCGFRSPTGILEQLRRLQPLVPTLTSFFPLLENGRLTDFYKTLVSTPKSTLQPWVANLQALVASPQWNSSLEDRWFSILSEQYPDDPGCLAPYYLNLRVVAPGEALFIGAGVLHAYLEGFGLEVMANSDNVLRGGLTSKHMDLEALLRTVTFKPEEVKIYRPSRRQLTGTDGVAWEDMFVVPVEEFFLSVVNMEAHTRELLDVKGPEILLCGSGMIHLEDGLGEANVTLSKGQGCIVEAVTGRIQLSGTGSFYRIQVGMCVYS